MQFKNFFDSKTFVGVAILAINYIMTQIGVEAFDASILFDGLTVGEVLNAVGAALTAIGIRTADKPLSLSAPITFFGLVNREKDDS